MAADALTDPFMSPPPPVQPHDPAAPFLRAGIRLVRRPTEADLEWEREHGDDEGRDETTALHRYETQLYGR